MALKMQSAVNDLEIEPISKSCVAATGVRASMSDQPEVMKPAYPSASTTTSVRPGRA